ncbi:uncharacterized protein DFL_006607 [Arthrobotrys flagrans]|uniref:F-box domain-containing protein n=1 Tax=Arthrobotrys flagrans TaxID=97331 RepID=A0A436ZTV6_ARTFL|nr:hypothetical protein DFL_006607 [Arthrobotrys flagrans]
MHIHDLPTELHIQILKYLPSISDQISISLTCQRWQSILNAPDFQRSRYNFLPPYNIGIHKFFDDTDNPDSSESRLFTDQFKSPYGHEPAATRLGCEYNCDTGKIASYYYLFGHRDNNEQPYPGIQSTKYNISKCPFLDEPLINHGVGPEARIVSFENSNSMVVNPMENREISRYRKLISQDPIRPMTVGEYATGDCLIRTLRMTTCHCECQCFCSLLYSGGPGSFLRHMRYGDVPCGSELKIVWPANLASKPSVNATVREAAKAAVDGVLIEHLNKRDAGTLDPGYSYVRSFGFAAVVTAPWNTVYYDTKGNKSYYKGKRECRWWDLEGIHYGPWKKVHRRLPGDDYNIQRLQRHEGKIVDRMETLLI